VVVLDMYLRWSDAPERPTKGQSGFFRAGKRCQELLASHPETADVPIIYYTVLGRDDIVALGPLPQNVSFSPKSGELFDLIRKIRSVLAAQENSAAKKPPAQNSVFVTYSHKDKRFLDEFLVHLKPLERTKHVAAWSDRQIEPGTKWFEEIKKSLTSAKVAVMLVSSDFLASDFIHEHELGPLLKEANAGGVQILWVLLRACSYKDTALKDYQSVIPPDKPLAEMKSGRDNAWVAICDQIKAAVNRK
jgi:hypothetical protein